MCTDSSVPWGTSRPPPSRLRPCACQRSGGSDWLVLLGKGGERAVGANRGHVFLAWGRHLPPKLSPSPAPAIPHPCPHPGKAHRHTAWTLVFKTHRAPESRLPFLRMWPPDLPHETCNPATWQRRGGEPAWGTAQSSPPTGHGGLGPTQQTSAWGPRGLPFHPSSSPGEGWRKQTERFSFYEPI